jgi:hypothetical protein
MRFRLMDFFNQRKILVLLLVSLAMSTGLNAYLLFVVIKPSQEGRGEEETYAWIVGYGSYMWDFSIKIPNRAVFYSDGRQFNVSVKASYWAPFDFGPRPFYFKIYDKIIYKGTPLDEPPKLIGEKTVIANKSKDELQYQILIFNFTVTLDENSREIHLYRVVGDIWSNVTLTHWDCIASFAINIM